MMHSLFARHSFINGALILGAATSASLLAGAHIFERLGFPPCELCLDQREAHWAALGVALGGIIAAFVVRARLAAAASVGALSLVYALSAGLAFYHTGVEFGFWPGPPTCSAPAETVPPDADLSAALGEGPSGPSCGDALWRLFGISMAGWNLLFSAGLFALAFTAAVAASRRARDERRPAPATGRQLRTENR